MTTKAQVRLLGFAAAAVVLVFTLACIDRPMKNATPAPNIGSAISIPQSAERDVDMLFVIDDSGSMAEEQALLQAQFTALMQELRNITGGLPNVHLGVTSTDLGTGMFQITYCEDVGGDNGNLLTGSCANPTGAPYIVDVEPASCDISKDASGFCSSHTCEEANCSHEPSASLVEDSATGCPRCRNYAGEQLEDVFRCVASLGTLGCGFEQQLEAMYKALDPANTANQGFIRESAFLAVILITDEDDCSAANPQLFDNSQTSIDSTLGPLTSFRCFEFGITCDINSRTHQGLRQNCQPREDAAALLHPTSRYIQFLQNLKDPQMLVVAAIAGPVNNDSVTVGLDEYSQPEIQYSCTSGQNAGAVPGIRIKSVIEAFNSEEEMSWAYTSICNSSYTDALEGIGNKIKDILEFQCLPSPLKGCSDVGAEFTVGGQDDCLDNDVCQAQCSVQDIFQRGTDQETKSAVPPCLEVCNDGLCPGNTDRSVAYMSGHPDERDANLPLPPEVHGCWHINYQEMCPGSNYSEIIISRKADPPPRSFSEVACVQISQTEQLCNDGIDNDEDCKVDADDEDCQAL